MVNALSALQYVYIYTKSIIGLQKNAKTKNTYIHTTEEIKTTHKWNKKELYNPTNTISMKQQNVHKK